LPIFMDRHDMRGMTAENVAEAHRKDLQVQDRYGVKYLTYWFDGARGTNFCLVEAPDAATAERVHREAHGDVATDIIAVDLAVVEAFLGRIGDPKAAPGTTAPVMGPGLRAVMFTDIVGSTEMTLRLGDSAALEMIRVHDALVRRGLTMHRGREVKHIGDGIMAAFDNVAEAVRAAADIQWHFDTYNRNAAESLSVRIGIHAGEPVANHDDLFGATVHLASRLCREAEANGIIVSQFVHEMCGLGAECFVPLGERRLKGFADPVPVFRLEWRRLSFPIGLDGTPSQWGWVASGPGRVKTPNLVLFPGVPGDWDEAVY
jgi:class 3 adenylate cyclase